MAQGQANPSPAGTTADPVKVDGSNVTQPVSAAALPLPSGASTAALQSTGNTSLATIAGFTCNTGAVTISAALPAGTNVIGHVINDASSAVIGHVIVDSGSIVVTNAGTFAVQAVCTNAGTFAVQAAQSGTWNITNISGTVSLPTGASTAAKQPALGTAGSASADVITIQGISSMTKLLVTPDSVALPANQSVNVSQINGVTTLMGNGVTGTGSQRVTIASDNTAFAVNSTLSAETTKVIGTVNIASAQTLATVTTVTTVSTVTAVTAISNALPAGTNTLGQVGLVPVTSGGSSLYSVLSTAAVLTAQIKGSAGQVYSLEMFNTTGTIAYVRLYNQTGAPASTDGANILWRGAVPSNTSGAGFVVDWPEGKAFGTGIGIRATYAIADNDTTVLAAGVVFNVGYK